MLCVCPLWKHRPPTLQLHNYETLKCASLQPKTHDGSLLPENEGGKLGNRFAVNVMPINLVQDIARMDKPALFRRPAGAQGFDV